MGALKRAAEEIRTHNRCVLSPNMLLATHGETLRANALRKYARDGATCDKEKYVALYLSACIREIKVRPFKYLIRQSGANYFN